MKAHTRLKRIAALHEALPTGLCKECGKLAPCPTAELAVFVAGTTVKVDGARDGETFEASFDEARLNAQAKAVFEVMKDWDWHTLAEVADRTGAPQSSVSARLRDFRKAQFGGVTVERRRRVEGLGTYEYRIAPASLAPVGPAENEATAAEDVATVPQAA